MPAPAPAPAEPAKPSRRTYSNYAPNTSVTSSGFAANVYSAFIDEYNRTGNANNFSPGFIANLRKNWAAQADAYEAGLGWIMWTWKTEDHTADDWSYKAGVRHGWIPRDPTDRSFSC